MSTEVEDKGSRIRVNALNTIPIGQKAYVKIETNMGVTGWGEINNMETQLFCLLFGDNEYTRYSCNNKSSLRNLN